MRTPIFQLDAFTASMLAPYWANRLGKTEFRAFQASRRGGEIICRLAGDRIELEGSCVFYLEGEVEI
jgi:predicted PhzF superfamily epimerase YddE/YHI9